MVYSALLKTISSGLVLTYSNLDRFDVCILLSASPLFSKGNKNTRENLFSVTDQYCIDSFIMTKLLKTAWRFSIMINRPYCQEMQPPPFHNRKEVININLMKVALTQVLYENCTATWHCVLLWVQHHLIVHRTSTLWTMAARMTLNGLWG